MKNWMNRYVLQTMIATAVLLISVVVGAESLRTSPTLNHERKWRIGYLEGGPYANYQGSLASTVSGLMRLGWLEKSDIPTLPDTDSTRALWSWLSRAGRSRYLEFLDDGYWSSEWNKDKRVQGRAAIKKRMASGPDIDLFIAMGTWAGQDLVSLTEKTPVIVMSCSDPITAGIVAGADDSGKDNVHAWCDPTRTERRLRLFHDIFGFKKLGIIYEDTEEGRIYAHLSSIQKVSKDRSFAVIACKAPDTGRTPEECRADARNCVDQLAPQIDAFIVSDHRGLDPKYFPAFLEPFVTNRIPLFTTVRGPNLVSRGVLMGIAREDYLSLGSFYARTIAAVLNGSKPRDLPQVYQEPLKLAINLEAARRIGYEVPANVRKIADIVFDTIDDSVSD